MMRAALITVLFTLPFCAFADNGCTPNHINFNVCEYAASVEKESKPYLPIKITDGMSMTEIVANGKTITSTALMKYSRGSLYDILDNSKDAIQKNKELLKSFAITNSCKENSPTRSFISLGGEVVYEYRFKDRDLYQRITITNCLTKQVTDHIPDTPPSVDDKSLVPMAPVTAGEIRPALAANPQPIKYDKKPNIVDALMPLSKFKKQVGYNPFTIKGEISGYESFASDFIDSMSPEETASIKHQIDAKKYVFGVDSSGEFKTLMATSAIGFVVVIIIAIAMYRRFKR